MDIDATASLANEIQRLADLARERSMLAIGFLEAENGNELSFVVGGEESVLGFVESDRNPPYLMSAGDTCGDDPVLTAFVCFEHHTEYPRSWVIPMSNAMDALKEFQETGEIPTRISWVEA